MHIHVFLFIPENIVLNYNNKAYFQLVSDIANLEFENGKLFFKGMCAISAALKQYFNVQILTPRNIWVTKKQNIDKVAKS